MKRDNMFIECIETHPEGSEWKALARSGKKVEAIKAFRGMTGGGLADSKDVVEQYVVRYNAGLMPENRESRITIVKLPMAELRITASPGGTHHAIEVIKKLHSGVTTASLPQTIANLALKYSSV